MSRLAVMLSWIRLGRVVDGDVGLAEDREIEAVEDAEEVACQVARSKT